MNRYARAKDANGRKIEVATSSYACPCRSCFRVRTYDDRSKPRHVCATRDAHGCPHRDGVAYDSKDPDNCLPRPEHVTKKTNRKRCARCGANLGDTYVEDLEAEVHKLRKAEDVAAGRTDVRETWFREQRAELRKIATEYANREDIDGSDDWHGVVDRRSCEEIKTAYVIVQHRIEAVSGAFGPHPPRGETVFEGHDVVDAANVVREERQLSLAIRDKGSGI